ncbi:right-handed parallel beta-helix repeat-containing protein [Actinomycetes bacterium KLBMP 9759]
MTSRRTSRADRWRHRSAAVLAVAVIVAMVGTAGPGAQPASAASSGSVVGGPGAKLAPNPNPNPDPDPNPNPDPDPNPNPDPDPNPNPNPDPDPTPPTQNPDPLQPDPANDPAAIAREQAAEAARQEAEAAREAAEKAAELAEAQQKVRIAWEKRGRPSRMIVIRSTRVDVVANGQLDSQVPRVAGPVAVENLDKVLPASWMSVDGETARLTAAVVLTPGVTFELAGGAIKTLQLGGGAKANEAAIVHTGGGKLVVRGMTVTSAHRETGEPLAANVKGRPYIVVSGNGSLRAEDAQFNDLGTIDTGNDDGHPAIVFNRNSTGKLTRTSMAKNSIGLKLSRSQGVELDDVTVAESSGDGIVMQGDLKTVMTNVKVEKNGANGVLVTGDSTDRPIGGIATNDNKTYGVAVVGQTKPLVQGVTTTADRAGGLRISRSSEVTVRDFAATDQPIGVFTHVNSTAIVLDGLRMSGGRRGVVIEKSTKGLEVRGSTIEGARVAGVAIGGHNIQVHDSRVADARTGVRIERGAGEVTVKGLTVDRGRDGVVATGGTTGVVIENIIANNVTSDAVRTYSPGTKIIGGEISGGLTGIDVGAPTTITGTSIVVADEGIHSRSAELVHADQVNVDTVELGVNTAPGSPFLLTNSRVHALEAIRGEVEIRGESNDVGLPPLNLLGAVGVPLILLAFALELIHWTRQRKVGGGKRQAPPPLPAAT